MDISKYLNEDASAGVSMYLSFESNSTMSNAAYKTLGAIEDLSEMELSETGLDVSKESYLNNTLEAFNQVKENIEQLPVNAASPRVLKVFNQNILHEYNAVSSTPTKDRLLLNAKTVLNNSEGIGVNLVEAFGGAAEIESTEYYQEENKENVNAETEASSISSSVENIPSVIETKPITASPEEDEALQGSEKYTEEEKMETDDTLEADNKRNSEIVQPSDASRQTKIFSRKNYRKSVCEPNLNTNRPSRIVTNYKQRESLIPSSKAIPSEQQDVSDIPKLLNKMLKISNALQKDEFKDAGKKKGINKFNMQHIATAAEKKRNSLLPSTSGRTTRSSLMPHAEKRPFSFTHRMSVVVKTTLNSPARKMPRKSLLNGQVSGMRPRKSVFPETANSRRNIAPTISSSTTTLARTKNRKTLLPNSTDNQKQKYQINRQSLLPPIGIKSPKLKVLPTVLEVEAQIHPTTELKTMMGKKPDLIYTCQFCRRQFRVKSLLDAHKRSHEEDFPTTLAVAKKPSKLPTAATAVLQTTGNNSTQCKYCDKKFAIVRALHIHLLQNCLKIPPNDKRKLEFTEMNHVEKAQLPVVFSNPSSISATTLKKVNTNSNVSSSSTSSTELTVESKDKTANVESDHKSMAPPQTKLKKKAAHSGVYRTPSKDVPCHLCKQYFKSVLDYTNHTMTHHSSTREVKTQVSGNFNLEI